MKDKKNENLPPRPKGGRSLSVSEGERTDNYTSLSKQINVLDNLFSRFATPPLAGLVNNEVIVRFFRFFRRGFYK